MTAYLVNYGQVIVACLYKARALFPADVEAQVLWVQRKVQEVRDGQTVAPVMPFNALPRTFTDWQEREPGQEG